MIFEIAGYKVKEGGVNQMITAQSKHTNENRINE
jgi:hypothetical protein